MNSHSDHTEKCECPRCNTSSAEELNGHSAIHTLEMIVGMCKKCGYVFLIRENVEVSNE